MGSTSIAGLGILGTTGAAAASGSNDKNEDDCSVEIISDDGSTIVTLVEVFGKKFLFEEAATHETEDTDSTQSDITTYQATESGYPLEFRKIDPSISASDINSDGTIGGQDVNTQGVDVTPENFVKRWDVVTKQISNSCGDIAFNDHDAIEIYVEGGGAFSGLSVAGLGGVLCYVASGAAAIPTAGVSGALAAGVCSVVTGAIDMAIDVDAIPNNVEISVAFWDYDEEYPFNTNTSPTIAVGVDGGYGVNWDEMPQVGEYDTNLHLGLPQ